MILDKIENIERYVSLHPLFGQVIARLSQTDFLHHEVGKLTLKEGELFVNIDQTAPKTKEQAKLETHDRFIDIQIPLTATEIIGIAPRADLPQGLYNTERDITFYENPPVDYLTVKPGMFAIFFPEDAHAPAISAEGVKKIVIKVRVNY